MQVDLNLKVEIFELPTKPDGEGTYRMKIKIMPLEVYPDFKFVVFHAHKGEYQLYPGSYKDKRTDKWESKFEFSKHSEFYLYMLDEVIDAVEANTNVFITRTHREED